MSEHTTVADTEFSNQLEALFAEAVGAVSTQKAAKPTSPPAPAKEAKEVKEKAREEAPQPASQSAPQSIVESLRPLFVGMEALTRVQVSSALKLDRMDKALSAQESVAALVADARQTVEARNVVNRAMFEALHGELKAYRDAFMLETVMRPIIRDLISLHDETVELHRQGKAMLETGEAEGRDVSDKQQFVTNLEHHTHFLVEVLERMEVVRMPSVETSLNKNTQRVVAVEPAETKEEHKAIVRVVRMGFEWRGRIVRPEEVVIKKWRDEPILSTTPKSESSPNAADTA
jgi:molecular chaperone GrpE (heat shock protein)